MTRLLDPLRDEDPLPPSTVDIERAVVAGRRRLRTRWAGAVAVVAAVAVLVPVLALPGRGSTPTGPATQPELPIDHPDFDPLRRVAELTDVQGVAVHGYTTARRWQRMSLRIGDGGVGDSDVGDSGIGWVTVYAPGRRAVAGPDVLRPETGTPANPVGGRPAYWLGGQRDELLAWRWADDAWAFVSVQDGADRALLRRIAQAVRVDAGTPVTVPFTLPRPEGYELVGTRAQVRGQGDPYVRTGLVFGTEDPVDPEQPFALMVDVENGDKMARHLGANRTVAGRPAMAQDGEVIIFGFGEFGVDVQGSADQKTLLAIATTVRLVPDPADRTTWTTQPIG